VPVIDDWLALEFNPQRSLLDFNVEVWTFRLTAEQMQRVFEEWEKATHHE